MKVMPIALSFLAAIASGAFGSVTSYATGVQLSLPSVSASAVVGGDAADDLWSWRVRSKNLSVSPLSELHGRKRVLEVTYPEGEGNSGIGRIEFGNEDICLPIGAWIPPYVGIRARRLLYSVYPKHLDGSCIRLLVNKDQREPWRESLLCCENWGTQRWNEVSHEIRLAPYERVAKVSLEVTGSNRTEFAIADIRLVLDDGSSYDILDGSLPKYGTCMAKPLATSPAREFPRRPRIQFGIDMKWCLVHANEMQNMGAFFEKYLPEYDIVLSLTGSPEPLYARAMEDAPKNIFFQVQSGHNQVEYLGLRDALIKDLRGRPQPRNFNSVHGCSPLFREALEDQIAYVGSLGLNNVQQYDYTWYYPDGPWGFDRYSAEAFREDLSEKDEGLTIGASRGKVERTIHFWDYYECYCGSGTRLDASRLGLASWGEFQPKFDTPLRQRLHWLLVTYEWLRQAQRFGHWSRKYCYGAPHDYLLNGEGSVNGNDHVYLLRLKDTGIVSPEYFHNTCRELGVIYHSAGRYIREAKRYGKVLGLTVETSSGGGSTQAYWSCKTGYVIGYVLSALGHESFEYDHLPDGASWKDHLDRENKPGLWKNLALGMSLARAYRQAKLDGATPLPFGGVLYVHDRTIARNGESFTFAQDLVRNGVDYTWTDPQELPEVIGLANTVIVSQRIENKDTMPMLERWKAAGEGRRVLMATGDAGRIADDCGLPRVQLAASDDKVTALPFRCGEFMVVALINREAAEKADYRKWSGDVLQHVFRKQTYDDSKLLFPDYVAGADAGATVRVDKFGAYRMYSVLDGKERTVAIGDGRLRLSLGNRFCDLIYCGEDTEEFREFLARVKAERDSSSVFFQ